MIEENDNHTYLSVREVAARLGVSSQTVKKWAKGGLLHAVKFGPKLWRISSREVDRFSKRGQEE